MANWHSWPLPHPVPWPPRRHPARPPPLAPAEPATPTPSTTISPHAQPTTAPRTAPGVPRHGLRRSALPCRCRCRCQCPCLCRSSAGRRVVRLPPVPEVRGGALLLRFREVASVGGRRLRWLGGGPG